MPLKIDFICNSDVFLFYMILFPPLLQPLHNNKNVINNSS